MKIYRHITLYVFAQCFRFKFCAECSLRLQLNKGFNPATIDVVRVKKEKKNTINRIVFCNALLRIR